MNIIEPIHAWKQTPSFCNIAWCLSSFHHVFLPYLYSCLLLFSGSIRFTLTPPPVRERTQSVYSLSETTLPQPSSLSPSVSSPSSTPWQPSLRTASSWRNTVKTTKGDRSWVGFSLTFPWNFYEWFWLLKWSLHFPGLCSDGSIRLHVAGVLVCLG